MSEGKYFTDFKQVTESKNQLIFVMYFCTPAFFAAVK